MPEAEPLEQAARAFTDSPGPLERLDLARELTQEILQFCRVGSGLKLRRYLVQVARAVLQSVIEEKGLSFVVIFPRQSGKNELQAQIEAYLLYLYAKAGAEIVKISPTWKPQSQNAMRRLERVLSRNSLTCGLWQSEQGYIYRIGQARITFLSGSPTTNVVGATASTLLECDEAQSVLVDKWDRDISPMAASTNATRVFWGTAWTAHTLLGRERRLAETAQRQDGIQRLFLLTAEEVAKEVPRYWLHVQGELRKFGRRHPFVRTQYFSEEIDDQAGMFPPERQAAMRGSHPHQLQPTPGRIYAFLLDVGGEEGVGNSTPGRSPVAPTVIEGGATQIELPFSEFSVSGPPSPAGVPSPSHDATTLTIVEVDLAGLGPGSASGLDETSGFPVYRVIERVQWMGTPHASLYGGLKALIETWQPRHVVVDATGVGAGLASFLEKAYPERLLRFLFSQSSKSKLGWDFISVVETGRFQDWQRRLEMQPGLEGQPGLGVQPGLENQPDGHPLQKLFWQQVEACEMEVLPGTEHRLRWGMPDGRRDPQSGALIHDDLLVSAALCSVLDHQEWGQAVSAIIHSRDPLDGMKSVY